MALLGFHPLDLGDISTSSARKVEDFLQKYLRAYFLVILVTTIAAAYYGYLDLHPFKMGDWLINYQGGFIRRGFLGELFLQLSLITNINPGVYALLFQISFYALFLWFSYSLLRRQAYLVPYAFLILSPFIFTFQINDLQGGFRKEIIYIALLAFIAWTANFSSRKCLRRTLLASMALYPAVILSHEMLAVFLPYLVIGYVSVSKLNYRTAWVICLAIIPSVIALLAVLSFPGDPEQLNGMINSLVAQGYPVEEWGILWLGVDARSGLAEVQEYLDHYYFFAVPLFFSLIAFIPVSGRLLEIFRNRIHVSLLLTSLLGSVAVMSVALDWGRLLYIHLVSLFFLLFLPSGKQDLRMYWLSPKLSMRKVTLVLVVYAVFWSIPHAGEMLTKTFRRPNVVAFVLPYIKIGKHFYGVATHAPDRL